MMHLNLAESCRLSGEPLENAETLFEVERCPLPGIYPQSADQAAGLTSPLRVVQARESGFVQLAHVFDGSLYQQYAFSGGGAGAYRRHLEWFADEITRSVSKDASILEVGCGDGWLLRTLKTMGFRDLVGIDPSRAAADESCDGLYRGYFPEDLPADERERERDIVVCRHVLEHIESPLPFMQALAGSLKLDGELWIEVPDLESTLNKGIWSNFYQLHCNYFSAVTLDHLAVRAGLRCIGGTIVDVFGGSILRRYAVGGGSPVGKPAALTGVQSQVAEYQKKMSLLLEGMPDGSVGYGADGADGSDDGVCSRISQPTQSLV